MWGSINMIVICLKLNQNLGDEISDYSGEMLINQINLRLFFTVNI